MDSESRAQTGVLRKALIVAIAWLLLTLVTAAIVGMNTWVMYEPFVTRGVEIHGQVIRKEPENHQFIRYSYKVAENTYTGLWGAGCGNPGFNSLKVGDAILVTYDSTNPQSSLLGHARCWVKKDAPFIVVVSIVVPILIVLGLVTAGILPRL